VRVLGIDPGLTRCGLGVVEGAPGLPLRLIAFSVVRTPAQAAIGERLLGLEREVSAVLDRYRPDEVAVERVFSQRNVRTVMGTAQAGAVCIAAAARAGRPVGLHTPSAVKAAVSGSGRADKQQVAAMVARLLRLAAAPRPADATDALALAICHVWQPSAARLREGAGTRAAGNPPVAWRPRTAASQRVRSA
jgi:crossover junction endodeoxyribonuclease RuvC